MSGAEIISLIIQAFIAIGTVSAVIVAIWGEWLRSKIIPAKLFIQENDFRKSITKLNNGKKAIYYNLVVKNSRSWIAARNCRAVLVQIDKKGPNGDFQQLPLSVPLSFNWSPSEITPVLITINKEQVFDLGFLIDGENSFRPGMNYISNNFRGFVGRNEVVRYYIDIYSDSFTSKTPFIVEIAWDGEWHDDLDEMQRHLLIKKVDL